MRWAADSWWGTDKLDHFVGAGLLWGWLAAAQLPLSTRIAWSVTAWVGVEAVEWVRYAQWERRGRPAPWPYLCDLPSYRDLTWDALGAVVSALLLALVRSLT